MDDHHGQVGFDVADFEDECGPVGADHHGEPVAEVPDPQRVALGVQDVLAAQAVLER